MLILFLHGWQSTPGGIKPTYLKDHGHTVLNPALPDDDFDAAVRIAQAEFDRHQPDVVVGSSRGGAVAMNINTGTTPLVLLCPAWKRWGTAKTVKPGTVILHSRADDVVPFVDSVELVRNSGLPDSGADRGGNRAPAGRRGIIAQDAGGGGEDRPRNFSHRLRSRAAFQFGIGTLLVVTTMYAVLFAILRACNAPPLTFVAVTLFFTAVGFGQRFLFEGRRPGQASMIVGACYFVGLYFVDRVAFW